MRQGLSGETGLSGTACLASQHAPAPACVLSLGTELKVDVHTQPASTEVLEVTPSVLALG